MIVIKLVGKLNILFNNQLFCSKFIFVNEKIDLFSILKILLLYKKVLKSNLQIK